MISVHVFTVLCLLSRCLVLSVQHVLLEAVHTANVERVKYLLSLDQEVLSSRPPVLVDRVDETHGRTPLLVCGLQPMERSRFDLGKDCVKIAKMLAKGGANMQHVDKAGWDAVAMGAVRGLTQFCRYLLKHHSLDIDRQDKDGRNALMKAAAHGYFDTFEMLYNRGAKLDGVTDNIGMTALHYGTTFALQNPSQLEFFKNLSTFISGEVERSAQPSRRERLLPIAIDSFLDSNGRTCLMYAAISNNVEVSRALLAVGADPRKTDRYGVSAISMSRDDLLQRILAEAAARLIEEEHNAWLDQLPTVKSDTNDADNEF